ncbi:MAG: EF-P beta-lysylation protein EpmB [Pseudomonadales bacterium]|jgi:EF-P beta-lysylation protein EpmB|nr:EF-P beta-lysylation protein EpmB [Pseudomonadales bacterium]
MIPASDISWQSEDWRRLLAGAITDPRVLLARLELQDSALATHIDQASPFPVRVPETFLRCMRTGDPDDPVLRQVLALDAERMEVPGWTLDPLEEGAANPVPGLLHKYRGRALLVVTGGCAVHCRYCFRRHFPYGENRPGRPGLEQALAYLAAQPDVEEIILSGGDPLLLDDEALATLIDRLESLPQLRRLRIHTRFPVVIPQRITLALADRLAASRLRSVLVLHVNHAQELDGGLPAALEPLRRHGIPILNQAVLLAGVNDSVEALAALCRDAFDAGILPYYLHLPDRVAGTAHFDVPEPRARALYDALTARLSGYLVPRMVREVPGAPGKRPVAPRW